MKVTIAHLYYDLLNLYGESGNIKAIKKALEQQKISVDVFKLSINDVLDFDKYDFVYIGAGTEYNQSLVLKHLKEYKDDIKKYIQNKKFFLVTGNSLDLFGKYILDNSKKNCLNIFDFYSKSSEKRTTGEVISKCDFIKKDIVGFLNHGYENFDIEEPFLKIENKNEGIKFNNFYGTHLLGPILVRNSHLLSYIVTNLIKKKNARFKMKKFDFVFEDKAYNLYTKNLIEKISQK